LGIGQDLTDVPGLLDFLRAQPHIRLLPSRSEATLLEGTLLLNAQDEAGFVIKESYQLRISIPMQYPKELPIIWEIGDKIKRTPDNHINETDDDRNGSFCLGTPLRLHLQLRKEPSLAMFVEDCIEPYLYAISKKLKNGGKLTFGELPHGKAGIIHDYSNLFKLQGEDAIRKALHILSLRIRRANKKLCPCSCGLFYGRCAYRFHLNLFRGAKPRRWFRLQALAKQLTTF